MSTPVGSTTQRVVVSAAHLESIDGYTQVYSDSETDYAVYVNDDYRATTLSIGDKVTLADTTGIVVSVYAKEFAVDVDNISKIVPGVSGDPVYCRSNSVGFISGWNGEGALRCIFY